MHLRQLSLSDFRSYASGELSLEPGVTALMGLNGQGKTNLVEAIGYLATLSSHRVATDAPLVRHGAGQAVIRAEVVREGRESVVEIEINPGRANRARLNRVPLARPRDVLGALRAVTFAPEDLALVKGDPGERRRYLDELLVARQPRWAGVRGDYDRVLRQRNALLKSALALLRRGSRVRRRPPPDGFADERASALHTLEVWNAQLAQVGAQLLYGRLRLLRDLVPYLGKAYDEVSADQADVQAAYRSTLSGPAADRLAAGEVPELDELREALLETLAGLRDEETERGVTLAGPHRDEVVLSLGGMPAKGYASQGECWSLALGLRLASYQLLRHDLGDDPVLVLDDVFAELDAVRRERLAGLVAECEQVIVTAAVPEDVPPMLRGRAYAVRLGEVSPA